MTVGSWYREFSRFPYVTYCLPLFSGIKPKEMRWLDYNMLHIVMGGTWETSERVGV